MSDFQATKMCYLNKVLDLERFYLDDTTSDVKFTFKLKDNDQEETVSAHKILLAARSDVFHAKFYGEVKEKGDVKIVDATPAAFREFLKFFYLNKVELSMENVSSIMGLGKKYNVAGCLHACSILLKKNLSVENVCFIYGLAILYDEDELKQFCREKVIVNTEAVFASSSFLECSKSVLSHILDLDTLSCSEVSVFNACMDWVKSATGEETVTKDMVEKYLGELFYKIRFRSMTFQDFSDLIPAFGQVFSIHESEIFTTKTRQMIRNRDKIIECNRLVESSTKYYFFRPVEKTTFSSNEALMLVEVVITNLYVFQSGQWVLEQINRLNAEITVTNGNKARNDPPKQTPSLRCDDGIHGIIMVLPTPILIQPGNDYTIHLKIATTGHFYRAPVLKPTAQVEPNISIQFNNVAKISNTGLPLSPIIALRFTRIGG